MKDERDPDFEAYRRKIKESGKPLAPEGESEVIIEGFRFIPDGSRTGAP